MAYSWLLYNLSIYTRSGHSPLVTVPLYVLAMTKAELTTLVNQFSYGATLINANGAVTPLLASWVNSGLTRSPCTYVRIPEGDSQQAITNLDIALQNAKIVLPNSRDITPAILSIAQAETSLSVSYSLDGGARIIDSGAITYRKTSGNYSLRFEGDLSVLLGWACFSNTTQPDVRFPIPIVTTDERVNGEYAVVVTGGPGYQVSVMSSALKMWSQVYEFLYLASGSATPTTPEIETDPYANLPTGGDQPLPGGGAVGIPGFPGLTATSAGVIGLFAPTATQMQLLADFMWTDFGGTGTTVEEILQELVEALKRTISNPLDYIIGLNIIPSQGLSIGGAKVVRFGFISSGVSMPQLANQYFTVDCGSLSFDTVCGDTFLDYAPYSKFSIYLPYIGFKDVDPNDFVGHTIGVVYHGDCVTGGVTAYITKDGTVMYQYSGCCALNVPLSADNWGETISAAINVATGIVAAAASGGAAGLAQGALKGAASVAANPSLLSPQVSHSGAVSGGAGCMGVQFPFVIREAVNFHSTAGFNKSTGYPAYYYKKLGDVSGFTTVIDAHLSNVPMATQDEIAEIESLLESGVIL